MKKTDIAMIVLIASMSMLLSYFIANSLFGGSVNEAVTVKTIDPIVGEVEEPEERVFYEAAINPTVEVSIGEEGQSQ